MIGQLNIGLVVLGVTCFILEMSVRYSKITREKNTYVSMYKKYSLLNHVNISIINAVDW